MKDLFKTITQKKIILPAMILAFGIIFVLLSEYIPTGGNDAGKSFDEGAYTQALESRLEALLSRVEGISDVKVMVTLAGSERYRYETEASKSVMAENDPTASSFFYNTGNGDREETVLTYVAAPEIKGVSVVCKGGDNAALRQKVIGLIAGALNLGANRIYVTE